MQEASAGEGKPTSSSCPHGPVGGATIRTKAALVLGGRKRAVEGHPSPVPQAWEVRAEQL